MWANDVALAGWTVDIVLLNTISSFRRHFNPTGRPRKATRGVSPSSCSYQRSRASSGVSYRHPWTSLHCHQLSTPSNQSYFDWLDRKVNWFLPDQNHGFFLKMSPAASFSRTSSSQGAVTGSGSQYPGAPRIPSSPSLRLQLQQNIDITNDIKVFCAGSATAGLWVKEWSR